MHEVKSICPSPPPGTCAAAVRPSCGIGSRAFSELRYVYLHTGLGSAVAPVLAIMDVLLLQNDDPGPPVLRRHSSSDISKQKFGTMPLVPIRGDESNSSMLSANQTLVRVQISAVSQTCSVNSHRSNAQTRHLYFVFPLQRKLHDRRTLSMYFVSTLYFLSSHS